MEIKPCPFCGEKRVQNVDKTNYCDNSKENAIMCLNCFSMGSHCINITEAVLAWNMRVDDESRLSEFKKNHPIYMGVKEFVEAFSSVTEKSLRWQIHKKKEFGLDDVFIRPFGQKRILVDVEKYFEKMREEGKES